MAALDELTWLCIDTETTGIDPEVDRIVELAAVVFRRGELVRRMGMLVNPQRPIPAAATAIHGIRDENVAGCPTLQDLQERFLAHVRAADVLVGYNWPFDAGFLQRGLGQGWSDAIAGKPVLDALVVVRLDEVGRYWKGSGRHKLERVAEQLGLAWEGKSHRASSDCVMTCRVLWRLREHLPHDAQEASRALAEHRERQERDYAAWARSRTPAPA